MKRTFFLSLLWSATLLTHPQIFAKQDSYQAQNFSHLIGMKGLSDKTIELHIKLYQGYVNNTNILLSILQQYFSEGKEGTPQYAEIKRRLGWEFDGMRLHEAYFGNLGGSGEISPGSLLYRRIEKDFGSYEVWKKDFIATGAMRGIGWAILYLDPVQDRLLNIWVGEHDIGHLAGGKPILVMDVWEHAYLLDYGTNRMDYINAFFNNINWNVVQKRYQPQNDQKESQWP